MKTYIPSPGEMPHNWWVANAEGMPIGRLCAVVAAHLRGKNKPQYTPFLDSGDHVIVVNASGVVLTGRKLDQKMYIRHTGHSGGLKRVPARKMLQTHPERAIELAVHGMLPKTRLGRRMFAKLRVYRGPDHPHQAQKPSVLDVGRRDARSAP